MRSILRSSAVRSRERRILIQVGAGKFRVQLALQMLMPRPAPSLRTGRQYPSRGCKCCGAKNMQCMQACLRIADMELLRLMLAFAARPPVQGHLHVTLYCAGQPIVTIMTQLACDMPCKTGC